MRRGTERLVQAAGIAPGMRVLDLGTGAGSVALLAARMVGPSGAVVTVDRDPDALALAAAHAEREGIRNVDFVEGDVRRANLVGAVDGRMLAELCAHDAVLVAPMLVGAWTRVGR